VNTRKPCASCGAFLWLIKIGAADMVFTLLICALCDTRAAE